MKNKSMAIIVLVLVICLLGCKHEPESSSISMTISVFLEEIGNNVEHITANQTQTPGITWSEDKKTANVWGVEL